AVLAVVPREAVVAARAERAARAARRVGAVLPGETAALARARLGLSLSGDRAVRDRERAAVAAVRATRARGAALAGLERLGSRPGAPRELDPALHFGLASYLDDEGRLARDLERRAGADEERAHLEDAVPAEARVLHSLEGARVGVEHGVRDRLERDRARAHV